MAVNGRFWLLISLLVGFALPADPAILSAQAPQEKKPTPIEDDDKQPIQVIPFWQSDQGDGTAAALTLIGSGDPLGALAMRMAVSQSPREIEGWPFVFDRVLPITRRFLDHVRDNRPWPDLSGKVWRELRGADLANYVALNEAIARSHVASVDMFDRSAVAHEEVKYGELATHPRQYRGEIITVKGKMPFLRKIPAPRKVSDEIGITHVYTGSVVNETKGAPPFVILFTDLPEGVKPSEEFNGTVVFKGYFIAHIRFPADKDSGGKDVVAPYLVGKTITVTARTPPAPPRAQAYDLMFVAVGAVAAVLVFFAAIIVWMRRVDRRTQEQLTRARAKAREFELEPDDQAPANPGIVNLDADAKPPGPAPNP